MHLGLRSVREEGLQTEFVLDPSALLEPGSDRVKPDRLCAGLQRGLLARGWSDAGGFDSVDGALVHVVRQGDSVPPLVTCDIAGYGRHDG
jgi:hypothetical protein